MVRSSRIVVLLLALAAPLGAQGHHLLLGVGPGSLNPDDPFTATFSFRGSVGWVLSEKSAIMLAYTRQSGNRTTNEDLGRYARQFFGLSWNHAVREAFADDEHLKQQYFLTLGGGFVNRGDTRDLDPVQDLKSAPFLGAGLSIRYPLTNRLAMSGVLEDDFVLLPRQHMLTRCNATSCYPMGSGNYYTFDVPGGGQHNFGLFILVQWRP